MNRRFGPVLVFAAVACTSSSESLLGAWRSDALNLRVTKDSTTVWTACTYGKIPGMLRVDGSGRFNATFDFTFIGGAAGGQAVTRRLLLDGFLQDDRLTITLDAMGGAPPETHHLERGEGTPYLPCP